MKIEKVALIGAGAVGGYFIWGLYNKLGDNFCVIAKGERKTRLINDGLIINGEQYFPRVEEPQVAGAVDLILVASKQDALVEVVEDIIPLMGKDTVVISLLNGVTSEEIIGNSIGMEHMLYAIMRIASMRDGNTITFYPEITKGLFVGEKDTKEPTERILAVEKLFRGTGVRYNFVEDIINEMWMKYAGNVSQNLPQAILGVGYGAYSDSTHVNYIADCLWKEVAKVAGAKGVYIPDKLILFGGSKPEARFSTLQDLDAGRHTEIEIFAGEMIRMGKKYGIEVPYCECVYHFIKAMEEKNDGKFNNDL
ncbi:MAG: ketopantoate reductase family protein [Lachnospiraceae bacterium]|nr:ketopantoate reductase family protein [Lachnospiraceae bacterium]